MTYEEFQRCSRFGQEELIAFAYGTLVDDSPQEREQVRQALPDIGVIDLPAFPGDNDWGLRLTALQSR